MKNFFKRIFFWDNPAAGAVFGWLLNIVYCYCAANLGCLSDTFFMALHGAKASDTFVATLVLFMCLLILQLVLLLYSTFLTCKFFYLQDRVRCKVVFWTIILLHIAALSGLGWKMR